MSLENPPYKSEDPKLIVKHLLVFHDVIKRIAIDKIDDDVLS